MTGREKRWLLVLSIIAMILYVAVGVFFITEKRFLLATVEFLFAAGLSLVLKEIKDDK